MVDEELELRHSLGKLMAMVGTQLEQGVPTAEILQMLEDATAACRPFHEELERAQAEAWFEAQAKALKPRRMKRGGYVR